MSWPEQPHPTDAEVRSQWQGLCKDKIPESEGVRFYPTVGIALSDIVRGLMGMYANKKHVVRLKGLYRGHSALVRGMSQEGALIQDIDYPKSLEVAELQSVVKKETLCVLMGSDSPWTREVFPIAPLWRSVIEAKIFAINVSHLPPRPAAPWQSVGTHGIWVHEFPDRSCVVLFGSRYRAASGIFGAPWVQNLKSEWFTAHEGTPRVVFDFERKYAGAGAPKLSSSRACEWAVIVFDDVDASAVREMLIQTGEASWASQLEALSLCRWESSAPFEDLLERGWTLENLRGALLVSERIVPAVESVLDGVLSELRRLQSK